MCKLYKVTKCPSGVSVSSSRVFMDPDGETIILSSQQSVFYAKLLLELPVLLCYAENQELCKAGCRGSNMSSAALVPPSTEHGSAAGARVPPGTAFGLQRSLATGGSSGSFSSPPPFPLRNAGASCSDFDAGA